ncbi:TonB family protein [Sphingomonas beigongshangi]|jgi:TonB family protein|uniref:TonB family protein n=1 Tax=Sphingomonas beigongshangi TaxID=2782540 RepID=UPI001AEEE6A9|nr:TonB family protein [Sphingomonas beigongshangi]
MIDADEPAAPTILYAGTRPPPRPRRRLSGDNRSLMIGVLLAIAAIVIAGTIVAAMLAVRGYQVYRDRQRQELAAPPQVIGARPRKAAEVASPRVLKKGFVPAAPIGDQGSWFPPDAYPAEARRRGEEGRVSVVLAIDAQGRVAGCTVTTSSGSEILDEQTCALARRNARFLPARQDGVAVGATYRMRGVRWALDPAASQRMEVGQAPRFLVDQVIEVVVTPEGAVSGCKVVRQGTPSGDPCASAPIGRKLFAPPMRNGRPTTARVRLASRMLLLPAP